MLFMPLFKCLAVIYTEQDDKMKYEQKKNAIETVANKAVIEKQNHMIYFE